MSITVTQAFLGHQCVCGCRLCGYTCPGYVCPGKDICLSRYLSGQDKCPVWHPDGITQHGRGCGIQWAYVDTPGGTSDRLNTYDFMIIDIIIDNTSQHMEYTWICPNPSDVGGGKNCWKKSMKQFCNQNLQKPLKKKNLHNDAAKTLH